MLGDFAALQGESFSGGPERDGAFGGFAEQAVQHAPVLEGECGHAVVRWNDGIGVDEIFEKVIDAGATGSGEIWSQVPTVAE